MSGIGPVEIRPGQSGRLLIITRYVPERVTRVKTIPGRVWHPERRCWSIPDTPTSIARVLAVFEDQPIRIDAAVTDRLLAAARSDDGSVHLLKPCLLEATRHELRLRGYSPKTWKAYLNHIKHFLRHHSNGLQAIGPDHARAYLLSRIEGERLSRAFHDQAVSALHFFFRHVIHQPEGIQALPRPRRERRLPAVLSRQEVNQLLAAVDNLRHRALLLLIYSAGLRSGEAVRLHPEDLDRGRGLIHVRGGKGRKDRYTLLSEKALVAVDMVLGTDRAAGRWLFPGARPDRHISTRTVQHVIERARRRAIIQKHVTPHTLRHSLATHLLEAGTDLCHIQELLGHASTRTTEIYTHVSRRELGRIRSPLDLPDERDQ